MEDADGSAFEVNFRLSYDFNAMALVEEKTGLSMMSGTIFANATARKTQVLLWAGIVANNPDYAGDEGLEVIGTYLSLDNAAKALDAIMEAFFMSLPKQRAEELKKLKDAKEADPTPTEQAAS